MFNIHVGFPQLATGLLHAIDRRVMRDAAPHARIVPKSKFKSSFRPIVNNGRVSTKASQVAWVEASDYIFDLCEHQVIAISQNSMLGSSREILSPKKYLTQAKSRLQNLREMFNGNKTTIHFTISNQFDYLRVATKRHKRKTFENFIDNPLSWFEIVSKLASDHPDQDFVVWDFENPEAVALGFVVAMLGIEEDQAVLSLHSHLLNKMALNAEVAGLGRDNEFDYDIVASKLDDLYDEDLNKLESHSRIRLVRWNSIPQEFRV